MQIIGIKINSIYSKCNNQDKKKGDILKFDPKNNDTIIIKISNDDIKKIETVISKGNKIFKKKLDKIKTEELSSIKKYDFNINKNITISHQQLVADVIKFVINNYKEELDTLELVFLACSFGRQTNKLESDLDLHFIYKTDKYKHQYEEIICYIITRILEKNRDDIDPKLIINFNKDLKKECELLMTDNDLEIILRSDKKEIKYKYLSNKKKKFFLQYNNYKKICDLENYILSNGILDCNLPWAHSYNIIYGNNIFEKMYLKIYNKEKQLLSKIYLKKQIDLVIEEINLINLDPQDKNIATIKKNYQSKVFTSFYKYLNIIRLYYIKKGYDIKYLKLYELYDIIDSKYQRILDYIFIYIWEVKKISKYCNLNNISYSIHKADLINNYNLENLRELFIVIKKEILNNLEEMKEDNEK